jgi:hypothetical protein
MSRLLAEHSVTLDPPSAAVVRRKLYGLALKRVDLAASSVDEVDVIGGFESLPVVRLKPTVNEGRAPPSLLCTEHHRSLEVEVGAHLIVRFDLQHPGDAWDQLR